MVTCSAAITSVVVHFIMFDRDLSKHCFASKAAGPCASKAYAQRMAWASLSKALAPQLEHALWIKSSWKHVGGLRSKPCGVVLMENILFWDIRRWRNCWAIAAPLGAIIATTADIIIAQANAIIIKAVASAINAIAITVAFIFAMHGSLVTSPYHFKNKWLQDRFLVFMAW